ncbi:hypothetical protein FRC04_011135 [Tulasnella sp. 424]|nr:hypothetical protein FRC04_011135 [Tulasnella sp. 424]KAG8978448.1 hypothetical protein FRC05_010693 [Tulasnella sp. 425]
MQTYLRAHVNAGLRPQRYANIYQQPFQLRFATRKPAGFTRQVHAARPQTRASAEPAALARAQTRHTFSGRGLLGVGAGTIAAVGLHLTLQPKVYCEPTTKPTTEMPPEPAKEIPITNEAPPPPPGSSVNVYELSFGTVCGLCAGVFVKKGAKAVAFFLGGIFVLLQYLSSVKVVTINWGLLSSHFEKRFYEKPTSPGGKAKPPTVTKVFNWLVNFLMADFQPRATFLAGFLLGIRVG